MFYNRGEVMSDQFDHLKIIGFKVSVVLFKNENGKIWEFSLKERGVPYSLFLDEGFPKGGGVRH